MILSVRMPGTTILSRERRSLGLVLEHWEQRSLVLKHRERRSLVLKHRE